MTLSNRLLQERTSESPASFPASHAEAVLAAVAATIACLGIILGIGAVLFTLLMLDSLLSPSAVAAILLRLSPIFMAPLALWSVALVTSKMVGDM